MQATRIEQQVEYITHNLREQKEIEEHSGQQLSDMNHGRFARFVFKCVLCGEWVNSSVVAFYCYDVSRVECYDCQRSNRAYLEARATKKPVAEPTNYWGADTYAEIF